MKAFLSASIVLLFSATAYAQKEIKVEEARENIGDTVKVCSKIFDGKFDEHAKGSPTYLYLSPNNADATLSLVIWGERRKYFDYKPEKDLKEREVCVTGKVELLKDKPVIIVEKQSQIEIK